MSGDRLGPHIDQLVSPVDLPSKDADQSSANSLARLRAKAEERNPGILGRIASKTFGRERKKDKPKMLAASHRGLDLGLASSERPIQLQVGSNFKKPNTPDRPKSYRSDDLKRAEFVIRKILDARALQQWETKWEEDKESERSDVYVMKIINTALPRKQRRSPIKVFTGTVGEIKDSLNKYLEEALLPAA